MSDNRFLCDGRMFYLARATRHGTWVSMAAPPNQTELDLWRSRTSGLSYDEIKAARMSK
ncbi:hypothetical protein [Caulobacter segnis]|uniref:hypothetical protein n=1 Tax=Caulobacter segnis TaxID=88688 RepID=UPI0026EC08E1|nr:hypothetical protein [Caulobacter segnis]